MPRSSTTPRIQLTLGQRYFAISFIIAQSAFLCSFLPTVASLSRSFFGVAVAFWVPGGLCATLAALGRVVEGSLGSGVCDFDGVF